MDQEKRMLLQKYGGVLHLSESCAALAERNGAEEQMLQKIAHELKDRAEYLLLARRGGAGSKEFFRMAAEEENHARRLKAMWYLTGGQWVSDCPAVPCRLPQKKAEALRQRYSEECRSAEEYFAMAEAAGGCGGEMLRAMGRDEQRHAETVLRILERLM
ncbi:MAG: hypothetical protein IKU12_01645 [Oscillospiraceae bacterium]|nr:hypothetical protein [Oscillospiraceae bacterium]